MSAKWYVLQVGPGKENKTQKNLRDYLSAYNMRDFIEEILVPSEKVATVKDGKQRVKQKRVWPGYILIKMILNDDSWNYVRKTDGVLSFLGGTKPTALSDLEVQNLLNEVAEKEDSISQSDRYEVGDKIKVIDGVFVNFTGSVTSVCYEKGRLGVIISIFGRETKVDDLQFWQVEHFHGEAT